MVKSGVLELVSVADIELDRTNPRIRKFLEMYPDAPTAEQIYLALGAAGDDESESSTSFEKLRNSILTNGGIIHPVILNRRADGSLICIEGNTRVALYKSFVEESVAGKWTQIPALVHDQMDENQADAIRSAGSSGRHAPVGPLLEGEIPPSSPDPGTPAVFPDRRFLRGPPEGCSGEHQRVFRHGEVLPARGS